MLSTIRVRLVAWNQLLCISECCFTSLPSSKLEPPHKACHLLYYLFVG